MWSIFPRCEMNVLLIDSVTRDLFQHRSVHVTDVVCPSGIREWINTKRHSWVRHNYLSTIKTTGLDVNKPLGLMFNVFLTISAVLPRPLCPYFMGQKQAGFSVQAILHPLHLCSSFGRLPGQSFWTEMPPSRSLEFHFHAIVIVFVSQRIRCFFNRWDTELWKLMHCQIEAAFLCTGRSIESSRPVRDTSKKMIELCASCSRQGTQYNYNKLVCRPIRLRKWYRLVVPLVIPRLHYLSGGKSVRQT